MKKKILFLVVFVLGTYSIQGQTILSSVKLELQKSIDKQQVLIAPNSKELFVFAADKEKNHALKYNSAFFLRDSISVKRPDKEYDFMAGYSFDSENNPVTYWASSDFTKIAALKYDFGNRSIQVKKYVFPFKEEELVCSFSENGIFYLLSVVKSEEKLVLYVFKEGNPLLQVLDLTAISFVDVNSKKWKLRELFQLHPLEKMETKAVNPLFTAVSKIKLFVTSESLVLTFDHNNRYTQMVSVQLNDYTISEKKINQAVLKNKALTNSYYENNKLYQIATNEEDLSLSKVDLMTSETKTHYVTRNDSIAFKNSPLLVQSGNRNPFTVNSTKKFLRRLTDSQLGISVYKNPEGFLITTGGIRGVTNVGNVLMGAALVAAGGSLDFSDGYLEPNNTQAVFFESLFDDNFQHLKSGQTPLAVDFLSQFFSENNQVRSHALTSYQDFYILAYYHPRNKEIILRKFRDGSPF